jgi:hypothetical protein
MGRPQMQNSFDKEYFENMGIDGTKILKWILMKQAVTT